MASPAAALAAAAAAAPQASMAGPDAASMHGTHGPPSGTKDALSGLQGADEDGWHWAGADAPVAGSYGYGNGSNLLAQQAAQPQPPPPTVQQQQQQQQQEGQDVLQMGAGWVPLAVQLGVPLYGLTLCKAVCSCAREEGALTQEGREAQVRIVTPRVRASTCCT